MAMESKRNNLADAAAGEAGLKNQSIYTQEYCLLFITSIRDSFYTSTDIWRKKKIEQLKWKIFDTENQT